MSKHPAPEQSRSPPPKRRKIERDETEPKAAAVENKDEDEVPDISNALTILLQGINVFVHEKAATPKDVDRIDRQYKKELHTDKLAEKDLAFLRANKRILNALMPRAARADADIRSLPTFLLQLQKEHYLAHLATLKVGDRPPYCWICNQVIDERASPPNFAHLTQDDRHWYFHHSCLEHKGADTAIKIYMTQPADGPGFGKFANALPEYTSSGRNPNRTAWLFFIEKEFEAKRFNNVFPNIFKTIPYLETKELVDRMILTIARTWKWEDFAKTIQACMPADTNERPCYCMNYLCRGVAMELLIHATTQQDALVCIQLFADNLPFMRDFFYERHKDGEGEHYFSRLMHLPKEQYDKLSHTIIPVLAKYDVPSLKDFFQYDGRFNDLAEKDQVTAQAVLSEFGGYITEDVRRKCRREAYS